MRSLLLAVLLCLMGSVFAQPATNNTQKQNPTNTQPSTTPQTKVDCTTMPPDMQQFAAQLTVANQKMFCGQFNDAQRATCMQMASQQDVSGKLLYTPDQAVQKTAAANNLIQQKTPTGCPVK